ncbi:MAG: hypothetical protein MUO24_05165 [Desulfobacterales bacterium]|nr:hypothetical protein [Desulfobacterales bacterium]
MKERETLIRVQDKGEVLILLRGRQLRVRPEDLPVSRLWIPMEEVEISNEYGDPMYTVRARNLEKNTEILAVWI